MIWPIFLSLFWAGLGAAYVSVVRREAELLFGGLSFLCWLGVAFSSTSIEVAVGSSLEEVGEPGLTAIGLFGVVGMLIWILLVVADRVPTDGDAIDHEPDNHEYEY
ncbi:hypothetical protein D8Y22_12775 [Salinadaptatus halalkaliphilus]|uniref:Uncharacterized protein n=1 Tax=Salinadaptatus halalkaliphilus TaxID=2419781 RepID=A0A4S3TKA1_9EURY|nr:hypothetical protein [Salinadaptatus halalkaliphilus]THE64511.1 hypothetical protein D8Y22_12775 [Salinadaptatus halalkaliphilus]